MILCDKNEDAMCDIPQTLIKMGLPVEFTTTSPHFDYVIQNEDGTSAIGVERKSVPDYFQSKLTDHLNNQLCDYSQNFNLTFLAVVGNDDYISLEDYVAKNQVPRKTFMGGYIGAMIKTSAEGKQGEIKFAEFTCDENFILFLLMLHEKVQEGNFTRVPKFTCNKASQDDVAVRILTGFNKVGEVKARDILTKYGNLEDSLMKIILDGTFDVKGIGDKIDADARAVLKHKYGDVT